MPFKRKLTGVAATTLLLAVASSPLTQPAHADLYHAVEPGETLTAIAARYHQSIDAIRAANKLDATGDTAKLPAMLLLIPDAQGGLLAATKPRGDAIETALPALNSVAAPTVLASATTVNAPSGGTNGLGKTGSGTIIQLTRYVVQNGDTIQGIAKKFSKPGALVSAGEIRRRNYISGEATVGTMLLVPVPTLNYNPSTEADLAAAPRAVPVGEAPAEGPRVLEQPSPVFQSPPGLSAAAAAPRRGNVLGSRGMSTDNSVLLVQPGQEATSTAPPSPRARVQVAQAQTALAKVAKVSTTGGTIRRLPDSEAVTLYRCAVGTDLAVIKQNNAWSAILMSDRSTGWIPTKYLKFTGITVDITTQVVSGNDYEGSASGSYNSNNPAVAQALSWLGTRYVYGGTSRRGIDCSALVMKSFAACGRHLPRTAAEQSKVGQAVPIPQDNPGQYLRPGDRLYFSASGTRVDHTGLYMGDGRFVHASGRGRQVMVSSLFDRAHWNIFVGARR